MRRLLVCLPALVLIGCGVETASVAATTAKLQAEQAKQGQETLDKIKGSLEAAAQAGEARARALDEDASSQGQ